MPVGERSRYAALALLLVAIAACVFFLPKRGEADTRTFVQFGGLPPAVPTYVQSTSASVYTNPNAVVTWPASPNQNDIGICAVLQNLTTGAVTNPDSSWSLVDYYNDGAQYSVWVFSKFMGASEPTTTTFVLAPGSATAISAECVEYANVGSFNAHAAVITSNVTPFLTAIAPQLSPTVPNTQPILYHVEGATTGGNDTTPSGWTLLQSASGAPATQRYFYGANALTVGSTPIGPTITESAATNHSGMIWEALLAPTGVPANVAVVVTTPTPTAAPTIAPTATPTGDPFASSAVPVITPEPLSVAPITTFMKMADTVPDGLAMDSAIWSSSASTGDNGFTTQLQYLCGNWYGAFRCFRHTREGYMDDGRASHIADWNYMASQYGIGVMLQVTPYDEDSVIATYASALNGMDTAILSNEPDNTTLSMRLTNATNASGLTSLPVTTLNIAPMIGESLYIGEGPTQDVVTITNYTGPTFRNLNMTVSPATAHSHLGGVATTLTAPVTASTPPTVANPPSPIASLPAYPGTFPTPGITTSITVADRTGIGPSEYLTVDCESGNAGRFFTAETAQVTSSYVATTGAGTVPLTAGLAYSHSNGANIVEGCIRRVPTNQNGFSNDFGAELARVSADLPNITVANIAWANPPAADLVSPQYGGVRWPYTSFDATQVHYYSYFNYGGPWGDGSVGQAGTHQFCFTLNCSAGSFGAILAYSYTQGGSIKPIYITETNWPIVPVGASNVTSPTNYFSPAQIPEDVGAAWNSRDPLFALSHGITRIYPFQLNNDSNGFCMFGFLYTTGCGGATGYGIASGVDPKASYYSYTDLIGLFTDSTCKYPGCTFTPGTLTWGWSALPAISHVVCGTTSLTLCGTDPSMVRSSQYEFANGTVAIAYWYESMDYLQAQVTSCATTTSCYQWCGMAANSSSNGGQYTCFSSTLYVANSHTWSGCTNIDTDLNPVSATFGHLLPKAAVAFNASDKITLSIKPEVQVLYCTTTGLTPSPSGTPKPFPTPVTGQVATADPVPTWAAATPVGGGTPTATPTAAPTTCATCLYVATSGNGGSDSNPGTLALPFLTIQKAANVVSAGKTVIVRDGTYYNNVTSGGSACTPTLANPNCFSVLLQTTGTAANPITFKAEHPLAAIISGINASQIVADNPTGEWTGYCFALDNSVSYVSIIGFDMTGCLKAGVWLNGSPAGHDITVSQNHIEKIAEYTERSCSGAGNAGVYSGPGTFNLTIDRNTINNIGRTFGAGCGNVYEDTVGDHGVYLYGHNITISNNLFYAEHSGWAVQVASNSASDGLNYLIANNTFGLLNQNTTYGGTGSVVAYCASCGTGVPGGIIENNVFLKANFGYAFDDNSSGATGGAKWTLRNNIYNSADALYIPGYGTPTTSNNSTPNPLLVAPTASPPNFAPQAGSPVLGAGFHDANVLQLDFAGNARNNPPSIGGYEQ